MTTSQNFELTVPIYDAIPLEWERAREFLTEQMKRQGNGINGRASGFYLLEETIAGKQAFGGPTSGQTQQYRTVFRKLIDFGALPNTATKSVAHGITNVDANFSLLKLEGGAYDPGAFIALALPYSSPTLNENISLNMDAVNVNITTGIDYSAYTRTIVTVEYIKEL